jgi:hypothetical protein
MNLTDLTDLEADDLLAAIGLATRKSITARILNAASVFAAGAVVGGVVALLLAPKSGRGLREDLGNRIRRVPEAVNKAIPHAPNHAADTTV